MASGRRAAEAVLEDLGQEEPTPRLEHEMAERIGFIGLGVMGRPMAGHLVSREYRLTVHTRTRKTAEDLIAAGGRWADSPADVARQSDVIITMLPDTPDVERAVGGPDGILEGLAPGSLVIDMSSISPVATRVLAARVASGGGTMLDAPVSGGEIGAINASLSIMVGGDADAFERAKPVLACMGHPDRIVHIGAAPGSGQICKVCNQIAIAGALAGVGEALALAAKAGVDAKAVRQALLGGFASSRVLDVHGERILTGNYAPGFRTTLYQKDLRLALETAAASGVAIPAAALVSQLVNALVAAGGGDLDYSAIGRTIGHLAGFDQ
jgi:2-hydroxy-3-oxopropionate reductase